MAVCAVLPQHCVFYGCSLGHLAVSLGRFPSAQLLLFNGFTFTIPTFQAASAAPSVWESVAITTLSDFGRTITSNGIGTDHGWGGNHMLLGGAVSGNKIHGSYPSDLTENGSQMLSRGRLIPTTPWYAYASPPSRWYLYMYTSSSHMPVWEQTRLT